MGVANNDVPPTDICYPANEEIRSRSDANALDVGSGFRSDPKTRSFFVAENV